MNRGRRSWQHIERFQVYRPTILIRRVGIIYEPSHKSLIPARSRSGVELGLGGTFGLTVDELADLMNEWLNRYKHQ